MEKKHQLFLALGSNLGDRSGYLARARQLLQEQVGEVVLASELMENAPEGFASENHFLNQVVLVETALTPHEVLDRTQKIEKALGRSTKSDEVGYQDRTCDIDIVLYDDLVLEEEALQIPHPKYRERTFVLKPLVEIAPKCVDPITGKTMEEQLWDVC